MPSTDDWTMPVLTCLVCDKDRDPLDAPDEPCGHGREYRHVVLVPVMPRRVTDEMVERAARAVPSWAIPGESRTPDEDAREIASAVLASLLLEHSDGQEDR